MVRVCYECANLIKAARATITLFLSLLLFATRMAKCTIYILDACQNENAANNELAHSDSIMTTRNAVDGLLCAVVVQGQPAIAMYRVNYYEQDDDDYDDYYYYPV